MKLLKIVFLITLISSLLLNIQTVNADSVANNYVKSIYIDNTEFPVEDILVVSIGKDVKKIFINIIPRNDNSIIQGAGYIDFNEDVLEHKIVVNNKEIIKITFVRRDKSVQKEKKEYSTTPICIAIAFVLMILLFFTHKKEANK